MAKAPPSFQFFPSDFVMGTLHLDPRSVGCYILLLSHQWTHGLVPDDEVKIARICRVDQKALGDIWGELRDKFVECEGGFVNARLERVRSEQVSRREKRVSAGRTGGKRRASDLL